MNLDNLKPAWQQFRLSNSIQRMDQKEIFLILERAEEIAITKTSRLLIHAAMFIALTLCCQAG